MYKTKWEGRKKKSSNWKPFCVDRRLLYSDGECPSVGARPDTCIEYNHVWKHIYVLNLQGTWVPHTPVRKCVFMGERKNGVGYISAFWIVWLIVCVCVWQRDRERGRMREREGERPWESRLLERDTGVPLHSPGVRTRFKALVSVPGVKTRQRSHSRRVASLCSSHPRWHPLSRARETSRAISFPIRPEPHWKQCE